MNNPSNTLQNGAPALPNILVIDNFDSFTYNLVDFFRQLGCPVKVYRNTVEPEVLAKEDFDLLVLSPGPSVPRNAGNLMKTIGHFYQTKPILGVCLGHQALIEFFGGSLANIAPVHGKSVPLEHDGRGIFTGLEQNCLVARYHSWAGATIPTDFEVSARSHDGVVMAIRHKRLPIEGIQFHPESVLSMKNSTGMRMLRNVIEGRLSAGNRIYHDMSNRLQSGKPLLSNLLRDFLQATEEGQLSEEQKQILLVSLSFRLQNTDDLKTFIDAVMPFSKSAVFQELVGGVPLAVGSAPLAVENGQPGDPTPITDAVDICGTGGSGLPRINTSTLASLLLARCGLKVVKHGNRAAAGRFGSFNLLESLNVPIRFDPEKATRALTETNLAFVFAPDVHPVFRHFAPVRAKIGVPTIFNVLGPLVNPLLPRRQFIGTAFPELMDVIFDTAVKMGKEHVIVVRGRDGLDEISISAPTRVLEYRDGQKYDYDIRPEDFGIEPLPFEAVSAASPDECLNIARSIIDGTVTGEHYKLVAVNAAFIYSKLLESMPLPAAYRKMERLILDGALRDVLEHYVAVVSSEAVPLELTHR